MKYRCDRTERILQERRINRKGNTAVGENIVYTREPSFSMVTTAQEFFLYSPKMPGHMHNVVHLLLLHKAFAIQLYATYARCIGSE